MRPQQPARKAVAVADRVAEREARGLAGLLQLLTKIKKAGVIIGRLVEADRLEHRLAVHQRTAAGAERQADPVAGVEALAVFLGEEQPSAIALADVVGDV